MGDPEFLIRCSMCGNLFGITSPPGDPEAWVCAGCWNSIGEKGK